MTLPKGYSPNKSSGTSGGGNTGSSGSSGNTGSSGSSGNTGSSGSSRDEIERMIGKRVENMKGIFVLGFILCWIATAGGIYVGVTIYPWAYPLPSGIYALSVLTVIEVLGIFWILKMTNEKPMRM